MKIVVERKNRTELDLNHIVHFYFLLDIVSIDLVALRKITIASDNVSILVSKFFASTPNVTELSIKLPLLRRLPKRLFSPLKKLQTLVLNVPMVHTISKKLFEKNSKLITLEISSCAASINAKIFKRNPKIQYLQINAIIVTNRFAFTNAFTFKNNLKKLKTFDIETNSTECFKYFATVRRLNLANCQRCDVLDALAKFTKLTSLNLKNTTSNIDFAWFTNNKQLHTLILANNSVLRFENSTLEKINCLTHLDLSKCNLIDLTTIRFGTVCPLLVSISLRENMLKINQIHTDLFMQSFRLLKLDLSFNAFDFFYDSRIFASLHALKILLLNNNKILCLPKNCFGKLENLEVLDVSRNRLSNYESYWFDSTTEYNVKVLNLSNNLISKIDVDFFEPLSRLRYLNLAGNTITDLSKRNLRCLQSLQTLDLSHNRLCHFHVHFFVMLNELKYLNLEDNQISALLPQTFCLLRQLKVLNLKANLLSKPAIKRLMFAEQFKCLITDFSDHVVVNRSN